MSGKLIRLLVKNQHKLKCINKTDGEHLIEHLNNYMQKNLHQIIDFNVGGKIFSTFKSTLDVKIPKPNTNNQEFYASNLLEKLANGKVEARYDEGNAIFIDRDPDGFGYILNFLRHCNTKENLSLPNDKAVLRKILYDAEYFEVDAIKDLLNLPFIDSSILDSQRAECLLKLCNFPETSEWKLLYRGSNDGFGCENFHEKADGIPMTLTIIKVHDEGKDFIFGGFTKAEWEKSGIWKYDKDAFLFSLNNKDNVPIKMDFTSSNGNSMSIYCHEQYGPTFGNGCDLFISDNANTNLKSCSNLGLNFRHPKYEFNSKEAKKFLAGSYHFQVNEIEVYSRIK